MSRRALVVGIDGYAEAQLTTCCNDAKEIMTALQRNADGSPNWTVRSLLGRSADVPVVTRGFLMDALANLFKESPNDHVLFYFSGHAIVTPWGPELATQDGLSPGSGVSFSDLMTLINSSAAESVTVILDSCYSGDLGTTAPFGAYELGAFESATMRRNVTILASARENQRCEVGENLSHFTYHLVDGLMGGAADPRGRVTALSLYSYAWSAMQSNHVRPEFKAYCSEVPVLRFATPRVSPATLRSLADLFEREDDVITPRPDQYDQVTELFTAGLIVMGGRQSIETPLANRSGLVLTRPGRHYWWLVRDGHV